MKKTMMYLTSTKSSPQANYDQQSFLSYRITTLHHALNTQATRILKRHCDLTLCEWRILSYFISWQMTRMSDLARDCSLDKGQISRGVKSLIAKGYLKSHADGKDARVQTLEATLEGHALHRRVVPVMMRRQQRFVRDINPEEQAALHNMLSRLEQAARIWEF